MNVLAVPAKATAAPARQGSELKTLLWSFRRELLVVAVFSLLANVLMLAPTLYMLQIYDRVLQSRSELTLLMVSLLTLFLFVVMAFAEWVRSRLLVRSGVRLDKALSARVFNASFEANLNPLGAPAQRAFSDLTEIRQFITGNGIFALFDAPWTPIYIAVLFYLHPVLGMVAIGFALVQAALAWWGHRVSKAPSDALSQAQSDANVFLQTKLRNAEVVHSMGMRAGLQQRWMQRHRNAMAQHQNTQGLSQRITALSKTVRYSQQALVLCAGALLVLDGQISPGSMIAANVLLNRALAPIDLLAGIWRSFIGARSAFGRLSELLQAHPQRVRAAHHDAPEGRLALRHVCANAPGRSTPILQDISLSAAPGTLTVVLGPSGSGKSTLARVLLGIWPDVAGEVLLDRQPIASWRRDELGPHLGYLPQDIELFDGTIAENIARFAEVDSAKVIAAAETTGLHQMILRLPKGYDTPIGEAGGLLSGGQRQRIGLARALYGDPALIVLDEPNANLDDAGQAALLNTVLELKNRGKTVFLITHLPDAVALADQLLVLRDGRVAQQGPRAEVLAAQPALAAPGRQRPAG
jgi:ATP-binding cassette, subfamily C, bacterial exporter for protease/lipase